MGNFLLPIVFGVALLVCTTSAKVISCGGFVKTSSIPVDVAQVQVKLYTPQGHLKYSAECTPNNGYFMIPVYNKGSYQLKVEAPSGWIFEKDTVTLEIDGVKDPCSREEDINFGLWGFSVKGKVRSGDSHDQKPTHTSGGPSQLKLALYDASNKKVGETTTSESGEYEFTASPGKYTVKTTDDSEQCVELGQVAVQVKNAPVTVQPDIKLFGHSLRVVVTDPGNRPLSRASTTLVSAKQLQANADKSLTEEKKDNQWTYKKVTGTDGSAQFKCIPPGTYTVNVEWRDNGAELSFEQSQKSVVIESSPVQTSFKATGFTVQGRVSLSDKPLSGVTIYVDGRKGGVSDSDGAYILRGLTDGRHTIGGSLDNYEFEELSVTFDASNRKLPVLKASKVKVCGSVELSSGQSSATLGFKDEQGRITEHVVDGSGRFCVMVPPVKYTVEPLWKAPQVTPRVAQIDVRHAPKLDLRFTQFRGSISGSLECLAGANTCKDVVVELHNADGIVDKFTGPSFKFGNIPPNAYSVKVAEGSGFCWEQPSREARLELSDISGVVLRQKGFELVVHTSHATDAQWKHESDASSQGTVKLQQGRNVFCVPKPGAYSVIVTSCHSFNGGPKFATATGAQPLSLEAESAEQSVKILTSEPAESSQLKVVLESTGLKETVAASSGPSKKEHTVIFQLSHTLAGQEIRVKPLSDVYLFRPAENSYTFNGECSNNIVEFNAVRGKYIVGSTSPAVDEVAVTATHKEQGDVLEAKTDRKGQFRIGPVWNTDDYAVLLHKDGYDFETNDHKTFKAIKLSELKVEFTDSETHKPLPDVLISLSGGSNYRSNNFTDATGKINYIGLAPGQYFLRPILQEYKFSQASYSVEVQEGKAVDVKLEGQRFAYSAIGKVTSVNGQPASSIRVEAVSKGCDNLLEEDVTDDNGAFRVRGLQPKCTYHLTLTDQTGAKLESYPPFFSFEMAKSDRTDVNFFLLAQEEQSEVVGVVTFEKVASPTSYRVHLLREGSVLQEVNLQSPSSIFFFSNLSVDNSEYVVTVDPDDLSKHKLESDSVRFSMTTAFQYVKLNVRQQRKPHDVEVSRASYLGIVLIILLTLIFLNQSKVKPAIERIIQTAGAISRGNGNDAADNDSLRRRRARKT